jgi:MFS family permease
VAGLLSERRILQIAIIADGLFVGAMYFTSASIMLYVLAAGFSVFNGLVFANLAGLISRTADQKIQGEILGINASVQALAQLIPPILSGFIAAVFAPEAPIIVAAIIMVLSGVIFTLLYKSPKTLAHIPGY